VVVVAVDVVDGDVEVVEIVVVIVSPAVDVPSDGTPFNVDDGFEFGSIMLVATLSDMTFEFWVIVSDSGTIVDETLQNFKLIFKS
jgi:hypothetical protein